MNALVSSRRRRRENRGNRSHGHGVLEQWGPVHQIVAGPQEGGECTRKGIHEEVRKTKYKSQASKP